MRNHGLFLSLYLRKSIFEKGMTMKISRIAKNDAYDVAMANLLVDDVAWKTERISGYAEELEKAYAKLNMSQEIDFLAKYRNKLIKKGLTGEKKAGSNKLKIVLVVAGGLYLANHLGYLDGLKKDIDKKLTETQEGQQLQAKVREIKDATTDKIDEQMAVYGMKPAEDPDPAPHNVFEGHEPIVLDYPGQDPADKA